MQNKLALYHQPIHNSLPPVDFHQVLTMLVEDLGELLDCKFTTLDFDTPLKVTNHSAIVDLQGLLFLYRVPKKENFDGYISTLPWANTLQAIKLYQCGNIAKAFEVFGKLPNNISKNLSGEPLKGKPTPKEIGDLITHIQNDIDLIERP